MLTRVSAPLHLSRAATIGDRLRVEAEARAEEREGRAESARASIDAAVAAAREA